MKCSLSRIKEKKIIKADFCLSFCLLHLLYSKLQICHDSNTPLRPSTWSERDDLIKHSKCIGSGRKQQPVLYNKSCC